jgi:branched-chain amino acid transport system substrate-binding protein
MTRPIRRLGGVLLVLAMFVTACGNDSGDGSNAADNANFDQLLGPVNEAMGEPVVIGLISDGATPAFDNTDELRAGEAAAEYLNEHQGGIAGRPIKLVTCETGGDPAGATDCGNRMVEEGAVAVTLNQSAVAASAWEPVNASGIPTMFFQASDPGMISDAELSFPIINPLTNIFGLPIDVAQATGGKKVAFVIIDVPAAKTPFETLGPSIFENAGLEFDVTYVPSATADMTSQMREVADSGADVVQVTGNDAFCIAAFQGLGAVGYDGDIASITQCITDATREVVPSDVLDGMYIEANQAVGATDDPTYQLYEAVMATYSDIEEVDALAPMGGYAVVSALATALEGIPADNITPETIAATIKAMPEQELPGGGGMTYRCGGHASDLVPSVCTNQWLKTQLDAEGDFTSYELVDSTSILDF